MKKGILDIKTKIQRLDGLKKILDKGGTTSISDVVTEKLRDPSFIRVLSSRKIIKKVNGAWAWRGPKITESFTKSLYEDFNKIRRVATRKLRATNKDSSMSKSKPVSIDKVSVSQQEQSQGPVIKELIDYLSDVRNEITSFKSVIYDQVVKNIELQAKVDRLIESTTQH